MHRNGHITLVTGGARSGKSALAERLSARYGLSQIYIATGQAHDGEMSARIEQHQRRRGAEWRLVEEPKALASALQDTDGQGVRLVDCLTLWLANCGENAQIDELVQVLHQQYSPVVLVTNELGQGIVPDNALARRFRDTHGWMNQAVAGAAHEVWMSVSGVPLRLKPARETLDEML